MITSSGLTTRSSQGRRMFWFSLRTENNDKEKRVIAELQTYHHPKNIQTSIFRKEKPRINKIKNADHGRNRNDEDDE